MTLLGATALTPSDITALLLGIAILLGLARILGERVRRYRQPAVLGEIAAGIILGPTLFGALSVWLVSAGFLNTNLFEFIFPADGASSIALNGFITISATLLLFVVGLEVDLSTVVRQGKAALAVSAAGIAIPFSLGFTIAYFAAETLGAGTVGMQAPLPFAIFVGISLSITALPVIAKILMDLNLAKSDMGMLIISSAMLNDLVGWIGFAIVLALLPAADAITSSIDTVQTTIQTASAALPDATHTDADSGGTGSSSVVTTIGLTLLFLLFMLTLGRLACHRLLPYIQSRWSWPGGVLAFVLVIAFICAAFTEYLGIHSIFGAFVAGVAIGDSHHLRERTRDTIHQFILNIFAPIFFASIGLHINFINSFNIIAVVIVFGVALVGKVLGSYFGARVLSGMGKRESYALGFGMAAQGAVGIILGQLARQAGLINDELMVAIIIMALGTSLISGPIMQKILQLKHKRQLLDFLTEKSVITQPRAHDVMQSIGELSKRAAELTGLKAHDIYRAVLQRERIMHTGLPGGLAVPHARLDDLAKPCVVIARSKTGIDFDAADGKNACIIGLLLTPVDQPESQIELLSLFATTFSKSHIRQRMLEVESATEFLAVLNQAATEDPHAPKDDQTLGIKS
ncbi:cation:proton antiporter domain-containing protein [Poriferisphaera sp. WC338]|uniref:cation:proton antiporter domain-containing protein n=1 Tax=Poriferisphaera sp. WC338 TaxID=3425129 RepID=UPI003D81947E